ncbi:MAG TPA: carboxypeptidase-like regulatory domain-containing protein [Kofleriaceae bacterium]|nr:carboxypeptidase-like regulatory domain-containing protein [Kofleriaceae bacterium]
MSLSRRQLLLAIAGLGAVVAAGITAYWLLGKGGDRASSAAIPGDGWHFRDGKWVRLTPTERAALDRERATRQPGTVRVRGAVRGPTGAPVPGAEVVFSGLGGEATTTAGAEGDYELEVLPEFYRIYARADGFVAVGGAPRERLPTEPDRRAVGAPHGERAPVLGVHRDLDGVDVAMRPSGEIRGTVLDERRRPIAGAVVIARPRERDARRPITGPDVDVSDLFGRFRLLVPAGAYVLTASHDDLAGLGEHNPSHQTVVAGEPSRVELTMVPGCIIEGQVVDVRGQPVGAGALEARVGGPPPNDFAAIGVLDEDGRFRYGHVGVGTLTLRAWPWKSPPTPVEQVRCEHGARVKLELRVRDLAPSLEGVIVDAHGGPTPHAFVDLQPLDSGGIAQQERADAAGAWAFYDVPAGRYRVTTYVDGSGAAARTVTAPGSDVRLVLGGTGTLSGRAVGLEHGAFTLIVERCKFGEADDEAVAPASSLLVVVDRGIFDVRGLPACDLVARAETGYRTVRFGAAIPANATAELELDLRQPRRKQLRGLVLDLAGTPQAAASIIRVPASGTDRTPGDYALSDSAGRFELEVWSGDRVLVSDTRGRRTTLSIDWDGDVVEELTATLR